MCCVDLIGSYCKYKIASITKIILYMAEEFGTIKAVGNISCHD